MKLGAMVGPNAFQNGSGLEAEASGLRAQGLTPRAKKTEPNQSRPDKASSWGQIRLCQTRSYQASERQTRQTTDAWIAEEKNLTRPHQTKSRQTTLTRQKTDWTDYTNQQTERGGVRMELDAKANPTISQGRERILMSKRRRKIRRDSRGLKEHIKVSKGTPKPH